MLYPKPIVQVCSSACFGPDSAHLDNVPLTDEALPAHIDSRHTALGDDPVPRKLDIFGGLGVGRLAADIVEFHPEGIGDDEDGFAKYPRSLLGHRKQLWVVDRIPESHDLLGLRGVVDRGVEHLHD
jgi:hypothetical protein